MDVVLDAGPTPASSTSKEKAGQRSAFSLLLKAELKRRERAICKKADGLLFSYWLRSGSYPSCYSLILQRSIVVIYCKLN